MITGNQGTAGPTPVKLCLVPAGPGALVLSCSGTAAYAYVGMGTGLSSSNGLPIAAGAVPVVIPLYAGGAQQQLYVATASGAASVGWIVTSPTGNTGTGTLG